MNVNFGGFPGRLAESCILLGAAVIGLAEESMADTGMVEASCNRFELNSPSTWPRSLVVITFDFQ